MLHNRLFCFKKYCQLVSAFCFRARYYFASYIRKYLFLLENRVKLLQ